MERALRIAVSLALLGATGCASTISAVTNRSIAAHDFDAGRIFSMTGERRLAMTVRRADGRVVLCAESLPEVAAAVAASSSAAASLNNRASASLADAFQTQLLQTFARTEISEVMRQLSWQLCQAWAQGALEDPLYRERLDKLIDAGVEVMKARASQEPRAPAAAAALRGAQTTLIQVPTPVTVVTTTPAAATTTTTTAATAEGEATDATGTGRQPR